jgi:hypothetical protein
VLFSGDPLSRVLSLPLSGELPLTLPLSLFPASEALSSHLFYEIPIPLQFRESKCMAKFLYACCIPLQIPSSLGRVSLPKIGISPKP